MSFFEKEFTFDRFVRLLITIAIFIGIIWLLDYLSDVLLPFVVALIIAYMLNPFINFIQKFVKKRSLAVFIGLLLITLIFTAIIAIITPMISKEIHNASILINNLIKNVDIDKQLRKYLPANIASKIEEFMVDKDIQKLLSGKEFHDFINFAYKKILPHLANFFSGTLSFIFGIISFAIVLLYLFFLLLDFNNIATNWKMLIPPKYKSSVLSFVYEFENAMNNYFRAQALIASIVGILFAIGFSIIGLPLGILLGLFIGLLNMVPYLQNLALIPAVFLALMKSLETGQNFWSVLALVLLVFAIVQVIQDTILTPKIMGDATGLNPAMILLSLSIWGKLLGILGLLIALPMTYLIVSYYRRLIAKSANIEPPDIQNFHKDEEAKNLRKIPIE